MFKYTFYLLSFVVEIKEVVAEVDDIESPAVVVAKEYVEDYTEGLKETGGRVVSDEHNNRNDCRGYGRGIIKSENHKKGLHQKVEEDLGRSKSGVVAENEIVKLLLFWEECAVRDEKRNKCQQKRAQGKVVKYSFVPKSELVRFYPLCYIIHL